MSNRIPPAPLLIFQTIGVLVDRDRWRERYRQQMAYYMAQHYGQSSAFWAQVDEALVADWASYHADLNYSGQDGIADMREGLFRTTRALFTIAQLPEPPHAEITRLSQTLAGLPISRALFGDVMLFLGRCRQQGYTIGAFGYLLRAQIRALTHDIPHLAHAIGADTLDHYEHDEAYFMKMSAHLQREPATISIVVISPTIATIAQQAGLHAYRVRQSDTPLISELATLFTRASDTD
ncbi:MAG: hypothetical protein ACFE0Q_16350 [Anaerolineae bacterium]